MNKEVFIIGAGGHAKVIANVINKSGDIVKGFLDENIEIGTVIIKEKNYKVIGTFEDIVHLQLKYPNAEFIIGIGNNELRKKIAEKYEEILNFYTALDPNSQIALDVEIGKGSVILANACINTAAKIGKHCIINTAAIIEHDNTIEDYVHISPNATLSGTVNVGKMTHIGSGAVIRNNINICNNCIIGAGAVVVKDIEEPGVYAGVPARKLK
ncbi:MAG: acetyltransferase [Clostridia bacterium]